MNKNLGLELTTYGLLLVGLSLLVRQLAPAATQATFIGGLAGGMLSIIWGCRAILGSRSKAWALLTLIPTTFLMLSQTFVSWFGADELPNRRTVAATITVMLVLSFGILMIVAYAGVSLKEASGGDRDR